MKILSKLDNTGMIEEVEDKRYVTDAEKLAWNGKADKTYVDNQDALKADKTYVDNKVKTDVPVGAKFTDTVYTHPTTHPASMITGLPTSLPADGGNADTVGGFTVGTNVPANAKFTDTVYSHPTTAGNKHIPTGGASGQVLKYSASGTATWQADNDTITTINGKTGAISKADITALGIPAQDTVYSHPSSHPASMITESSTKRFVSDSEKLAWNSKSDTDTITTINGKTGAISKDDIVALGIPSSDTNTTYTEITTAEIADGTASTRRTISGRRAQAIVDKALSLATSLFSPIYHTHSASDINSGTLSYLRIPRGTTSTTVAIGNHTHSNYASTSHTHTSFSGLTLSNPIICSNYTSSTQAMNLKPNGGSVYSYGPFQPGAHNTYQLGNTNNRWSALFVTTGGVNEGSDIRQKDNIEDIPYDLLKYFADEVKPKMFEVNGKTHFGYIAQDVERALYKYALDKVGFENAQEYVDEFNLLGKGESYLSLVYSQIAVVKEAEMQDRIDKLELQIEELKEKMLSLID